MNVHSNVPVAMASGAAGNLQPTRPRINSPYTAAFEASGAAEYYTWLAAQISQFARYMGEPSESVMQRFGHLFGEWLAGRTAAA